MMLHRKRVPVLFLAAIAAVGLGACSQSATSAAATQPDETFHNPIVLQRADAEVYKHTDGYYYFMATVPEYDRLELRRSKTIDGLGAAPTEVIWRKHATGPMGSHIWAPEIHYLDGKWFVYFSAGDAKNTWDIRIYALENDSPNPMQGTWKERGQINTGWESFALDPTVFQHDGSTYFVWAQKDPKIKGNSNIYIAKMSSPTTLQGKAVMLSKPDLPWEQIGFWVNEGPAVLQKNGKVFLTYSASATDWHYCLGMLTADASSNLLDPASWTKSPKPVFATDEKAGVFGPGHNCFTVTEDGKQDVLMYHARSYKEIVGDPLHDPNRSVRAQVIHWNADGTPNFGTPVPTNPG